MTKIFENGKEGKELPEIESIYPEIVKVWVEPGVRMLQRGSTMAAGVDLQIKEDAVIPSDDVIMVGTGARVSIPEGYFGMVVVRSSVGRDGVALANQVGIIDADYRGKIQLALTSQVGCEIFLEAGTRVAQLIVLPLPHVAYTKVSDVNDLGKTSRGEGGFGSSGRQ